MCPADVQSHHAVGDHDSVATTQALRNNLHAVGTFASTVSGDIDKINAEFDKSYSQLIARGATVDDPIGILFAAYQVVPCFNFKTYINRMHEDYLDGKYTMAYESLMGMAKNKYKYLRNKGTWGAKSIDDDKIVAMTVAINKLKRQLKLSPQLAAAAKKGNKKKKGQKNKNKKDKSDHTKQKKDEAWKKIPSQGRRKERERARWTHLLLVHSPHGMDYALPHGVPSWERMKGGGQGHQVRNSCGIGTYLHHQSLVSSPPIHPCQDARQGGMTVRASVDVDISNVSVCGWVNIRHKSTNHLPYVLHGALPVPLLVPSSFSDGSEATQVGLQHVRPREPVALASPWHQAPLNPQASQAT